jgi:hypothetical protein
MQHDPAGMTIGAPAIPIPVTAIAARSASAIAQERQFQERQYQERQYQGRERYECKRQKKPLLRQIGEGMRQAIRIL